MDSLPSLAFSFARFVAREERRFHTRHRTFGLAAHRRNFGRNFNRRRNFGRNFNRRQSINGGLRHRRAALGAPQRHYGHGGGLRRRHNYGRHHHRGHRWAQRRHSPGPGPSTRAVLPREEAQAIPEAVAAVPEVAAAPEIVVVPEVAEEQIVDAVYEDVASATSITADADDLLPPPPAFAIPPMEWLLGGPSANSLIDEEFEALPPLVYQRHGFCPCLPSPTPSGEDPAHFAPPGYDPLPEMEENDVAAAAHVVPSLPDLNLLAPDEEKAEDTAPLAALPTPSPEARVLLRRLASSMAARPAGIRRGTWSPEALGLSGRVAELRLDEPAEGSSRR